MKVISVYHPNISRLLLTGLAALALVAAGCSLPLGAARVDQDTSRAFMDSFMAKIVDGRCEEAFEYFDIDSLVTYGRPQGSAYREFPEATRERYRRDFCESIYSGLFREAVPEEAEYTLQVSPEQPSVIEVGEQTGQRKVLFLVEPRGRKLKIVRLEKGLPPESLEEVSSRELEVCALTCPFTRIQDAIFAAADGDTILVYEGTYEENIDFLGKSITLISRGGAGKTFIIGKKGADGELSSVVTFSTDRGERSIIDGFTISGGTGSRIMGVTSLLFGDDQSDVGTYGGGIVAVHSSPLIRNCIISGNSAGNGGGIASWRSGPVIVNSVISGNRAFRDGGGVYTASFGDGLANAALVHATVSGNAAGRSGGALSCYWSSPVILSSILWGNTADGEHDGVRQCGSGARASYSTISDVSWRAERGEEIWPGRANLRADPLFLRPLDAAEAPVTGGDYRLSNGSPAADAGKPGGPDRDLEGSVRPVDGGYDMGAYEGGPHVTPEEGSSLPLPDPEKT